MDKTIKKAQNNMTNEKRRILRMIDRYINERNGEWVPGRMEERSGICIILHEGGRVTARFSEGTVLHLWPATGDAMRIDGTSGDVRRCIIKGNRGKPGKPETLGPAALAAAMLSSKAAPLTMAWIAPETCDTTFPAALAPSSAPLCTSEAIEMELQKLAMQQHDETELPIPVQSASSSEQQPSSSSVTITSPTTSALRTHTLSATSMPLHSDEMAIECGDDALGEALNEGSMLWGCDEVFDLFSTGDVGDLLLSHEPPLPVEA